jgi:hypothetical protein
MLVCPIEHWCNGNAAVYDFRGQNKGNSCIYEEKIDGIL